MPFVPHVSSGQIVASSWGNLVADQVVMRFTTAAQRASQLTAPTVNQLTMRDDLPGQIEYWNGTTWLGFPRRVGFAGYNTAQAVAGTATTPITFAVEETDTDSIGAVGSPNMTIPTGLSGIYSAMAYVEAPPATSAPSRVELLVGGSKAAGVVMVPGTAGISSVTLTWIHLVTAGTVLNFQIANGNAGSITYNTLIRLWRLSA